MRASSNWNCVIDHHLVLKRFLHSTIILIYSALDWGWPQQTSIVHLLYYISFLSTDVCLMFSSRFSMTFAAAQMWKWNPRHCRTDDMSAAPKKKYKKFSGSVDKICMKKMMSIGTSSRSWNGQFNNWRGSFCFFHLFLNQGSVLTLGWGMIHTCPWISVNPCLLVLLISVAAGEIFFCGLGLITSAQLDLCQLPPKQSWLHMIMK